MSKTLTYPKTGEKIEIVESCPCGFGDRIRPSRGKPDETKFELTIGQEVVIVGEMFRGWGGHIRAFEGELVAVDLDMPPAGHQPNGQWFHFSNVTPVVVHFHS